MPELEWRLHWNLIEEIGHKIRNDVLTEENEARRGSITLNSRFIWFHKVKRAHGNVRPFYFIPQPANLKLGFWIFDF